MANPVVHFEVGGRDAAALQDFYAKAFSWKIDADNPMKYGIVDNDGEGIGGGIGDRSDNDAGVIFYIQVADLQAALDAVASAGGKTVQEVTEIPGMVTLAKFEDPAGNVIGMIKEM